MSQQISSSNGVPLTGLSQSLAKSVLDTLYRYYPSVKEGWHVQVNEGGGVVQVTNNFLSGKMGFVLHVTQIDAEGKTVMRAGGELLERYSVLRHPTLPLDQALKNTMFDRSGQMQFSK